MAVPSTDRQGGSFSKTGCNDAIASGGACLGLLVNEGDTAVDDVDDDDEWSESRRLCLAGQGQCSGHSVGV